MSDPFDLNGDGKLDAFEYALFEETLHEEEERRRRASLDPEDFGDLSSPDLDYDDLDDLDTAGGSIGGSRYRSPGPLPQKQSDVSFMRTQNCVDCIMVTAGLELFSLVPLWPASFMKSASSLGKFCTAIGILMLIAAVIILGVAVCKLINDWKTEMKEQKGYFFFWAAIVIALAVPAVKFISQAI